MQIHNSNANSTTEMQVLKKLNGEQEPLEQDLDNVLLKASIVSKGKLSKPVHLIRV